MAFAVGLWGTVVRPSAWEVRGAIVARAARDTILVRHEAIAALGMGAMDLMAVTAEPGRLDAWDLKPGDRVRLVVRQRDDQLMLVRLERLP